MGRSRVRVRVILKTLKMVLTDSWPVLVTMSLSKGNALAIKKAQLIPFTIDKGGIIQRDKIKGYKTHGPL